MAPIRRGRGARVASWGSSRWAISKVFEVYEDFHVGPEEYIDAGDKVVVIGRVQGTGKGSGLKLDERFAFVWTVQRGKLADLTVFRDRHEALEATGLSE